MAADETAGLTAPVSVSHQLVSTTGLSQNHPRICPETAISLEIHCILSPHHMCSDHFICPKKLPIFQY